MENKYENWLDGVNLREFIPKEIERHKKIAENLERFLNFLERDPSDFGPSDFIRKEVHDEQA